MLHKDYSGLFDFCGGPCEIGDILQLLAIALLFVLVAAGFLIFTYTFRKSIVGMILHDMEMEERRLPIPKSLKIGTMINQRRHPDPIKSGVRWMRDEKSRK